jgi:CheY-like chemotaxis protein
MNTLRRVETLEALTGAQPRSSILYKPVGNAAASTRDSRLTPSLKQRSILIIEDEEGIRALLVQVLSLAGYHTTAVDNGSEGVSRFRQDGYDLVVTDVRMPGMPGWDVAKAIKQCTPMTPVVAITGWEVETFAAQLNDAGVDRVVKKPFNVEDVLSAVSQLTNDR